MTTTTNERIAAALDRLQHVPTEVLTLVVVRDGLCMQLDTCQDLAWLDAAPDDRALAARLCADCPVQEECLELELRLAGEHTVGVWGALNEDDRRALHRVWSVRRRGTTGGWQR